MKIDNIRKLQPDEIRILHKECIKRDFPKNEVRPYSMVKRLVKNNMYISYGAYSDNQLITYATFFSTPQDDTVVLLDYFAVQPQHRGTGIGSSFFVQFKEIVQNEFPNAKVIAIECENPQFASTPQDRTSREKRINFYKQNGAVITQSKLFAFGVNYNLLAVYLDDTKPMLTLGKSVYNLYLYSFRKPLKHFVKKKLKCFDAHTELTI